MLKTHLNRFTKDKKATLLGVGPMSKNCVDSAIAISNAKNIPLFLIASRRQIDSKEFAGGYVNNWDTFDYANYVLEKDKKGNIILSGCNLDFDVKIGNFNIINNSTIILHDSKIGDFNFIGPNVTICGTTTIKNNVFIGAGAIICPGVQIGNNSVIGAGAVIRHNVKNNSFVVGNPQKIKS